MGEIESTAYHEAGHAVAARWLHRAVRTISIVPDEDSLGRVEHYPITGAWLRPDIEIDGRTRDYLETSITVSLAGPSAERKYRGRWNRLGAEYDRHEALGAALRLVGSKEQLQHYFRWREQIAVDFWEDTFRWEQVRVLAAELLERGTMSGRAVRDVLRRAVERRFGRVDVRV